MTELQFLENVYNKYKAEFQQITKAPADDNPGAYFAFVAAKIAVENHNILRRLEQSLNKHIEDTHQRDNKS
jgi:hypothetical protein